ncbi:hypothetical protein [Pedobacter miscanthi]|uniref:hypothetical protein n=1 Tax=Pedobacter miscanthi TaxID=2259170 RepID=UPI00292FDE3A|nr:hypothetical protein [Pedobacter miscanthi]
MKEIYKSVKGQQLFRMSFCAYLDILGFSQKIMRNDLGYFNKYLRVLKKELAHIESNHDLSGKQGFKSFELKIFTDNFVFGHPWFDQFGEVELGDIFEVLSHIQFSFAKSDIFIRGAISMSNLYMDNHVVLGPALVEAYKMESESAVNPRVILSADVVEMVKKHINYYSPSGSSPQNKLFLVDIDGVYFINYLFILFYDRGYPKKKIIRELQAHRKPIIDNLKLYRTNFRLFEKYAWSAAYHNYFCDHFVQGRFTGIVMEKIRIDGDLYQKSISRIV